MKPLLVAMLLAVVQAPNPKWYAVFGQPEGWLIIIGFVTLGVLAYQANEMRRATEAMQQSTKIVERQADIMERQTRLQEIAMRQWVSLENWHGQIVLEQGDGILEFGFEIVNPTKFPLKLEYVTTSTASRASQSRPNHVLGPGKKFEVNSETGTLNKDQIFKYQESFVSITVEGSVVYEDVFEVKRTQIFNTLCICSINSEIIFHQFAEPDKDSKQTNT